MNRKYKLGADLSAEDCLIDFLIEKAEYLLADVRNQFSLKTYEMPYEELNAEEQFHLEKRISVSLMARQLRESSEITKAN